MKPTHSYIARKPCGCCVGVMAVTPGDADDAKTIRKWEKSGLTITIISREDTRAVLDEPTFMACPHEPAQAQLF